MYKMSQDHDHRRGNLQKRGKESKGYLIKCSSIADGIRYKNVTITFYRLGIGSVLFVQIVKRCQPDRNLLPVKTNHTVPAVLVSFSRNVVQHAPNPSLERVERDSYPLKVVIGTHSVSFVHNVNVPWLEKVSSQMGRISFALTVPRISLWEPVLHKYNMTKYLIMYYRL